MSSTSIQNLLSATTPSTCVYPRCLLQSAAALALLAFSSLAAQAQFHHEIWHHGEAMGPQGTIVRPGDPVTVRVSVMNLCDASDSVTVSQIGLIVHRSNGDEVMTNLLDGPVLLTNFADYIEVATTVVARCDDSDYLGMQYFTYCTDNGDGFGFLRQPTTRYYQYPMQVQVLREAPRLAVRSVGRNSIRISWAASSDCFRLEGCPSVGAPWVSLPGSVVRDEEQCSITLDTSVTRAQFYRLIR